MSTFVVISDTISALPSLRRNREVDRGGTVVHDVAQRRRLLREHQTHTGSIGRRFSDRRVVQVEDEVRSLRNELRRFELIEILRTQTRD